MKQKRIKPPGSRPERQRVERKALRHEAKRDQLLDSARQLLTRRGLDGFSIQQVAAQAGFSKPAVYYYFDSKEALIEALAFRAQHAEVCALELAVDNAAPGVASAVAYLHAYVSHYVAAMDLFRLLYVWPQVLGRHDRLLESPDYPRSIAVLERLARQLDADENFARSEWSARRAAEMTRVLSHGIVAAAMSTAAQDGRPRVNVEEQAREAARLLRRALT